MVASNFVGENIEVEGGFFGCGGGGAARNQIVTRPRIFHFCLESASKIGLSSSSSWSPPTLTGNFAILAGGSGTYEEAPGGSP